VSEFQSYDEMKDEINKQALSFREGAKKWIPKLADALKVENPTITKEEIKDRILKDFVQYWTRQTILNALGEEYKDPVKQESGAKGGQKSSLNHSSKKPKELPPIVVTNKGNSETNNENIQPTNKTEESNVKDKLKSINYDLEDEEKIRLRAEVEELKQKNEEQRQTFQGQINELKEVVRKGSFTSAKEYEPAPNKFEFPEPDNSDTFVWLNETLDTVRKDLGPIKASGNTKVNVYMERVK